MLKALLHLNTWIFKTDVKLNEELLFFNFMLMIIFLTNLSYLIRQKGIKYVNFRVEKMDFQILLFPGCFIVGRLRYF